MFLTVHAMKDVCSFQLQSIAGISIVFLSVDLQRTLIIVTERQSSSVKAMVKWWSIYLFIITQGKIKSY